MGAPQIIMIILFTLNVALNAFKQGQPRQGNYNSISALIAVAVQVALLMWGGFFPAPSF